MIFGQLEADMSNVLKQVINKAIEVAAEPVLSMDTFTSLTASINQKYNSYIKTCGIYQDKKTKTKMVIAIGNVSGVRFVYQINQDGSYVASVNSKTLETKSMPLTTVGAVIVTLDRVVERAKTLAKAINNQDILKDKIYIGKEEASFITEAQVREAASRASKKIEIPAEVLKTKKTAIDFVKKTFPGITLYWNSDEGEFVVKIKGKPKADYFTNDLEDAVLTARRMHEDNARRS